MTDTARELFPMVWFGEDPNKPQDTAGVSRDFRPRPFAAVEEVPKVLSSATPVAESSDVDSEKSTSESEVDPVNAEKDPNSQMPTLDLIGSDPLLVTT
jgi:hypothetical protein